MKEDTKIILLEHALVNIAYDIDPDLRGCEAVLKSLSSGDTVSGNLKFRDTHSFTPRCKLIASVNEMIKVNDASQALSRRLMFCSFPVSFRGKPDTALTASLMAERSGIFNRIYRAYRELRRRAAQGEAVIIPCTIDQPDLLGEFTSIANPIAAFWEEAGEGYLERQKVSKQEVFMDFKAFCTSSGINMLRFGITEKGFHTSFFSHLRSIGVNVNNTHRKRNAETGKQDYYYMFSPLSPSLSLLPEEQGQRQGLTKEEKLGAILGGEPLELEE